jgi:PAS domain S-box-containing protein
MLGSGNKTPRLRQYYITALVLIAVLVTFNFFRLSMLAQQQQANAQTLRLSERQRTLSQRIALLSTVLVYERESESSDELRASLLALADEMEAAFERLVTLNMNGAVQAVYFSEPHLLSQRVPEFIAAARRLAQVPTPSVSGTLGYTAIDQNNAQLFLSLEEATRLRQEQEQVAFQMVERGELVALVLTLLLLMFVGLFVFRPMEKRIIEEQTNLQREIDERKRTQSALMTSETRFRGAFEHSPIGIALVGLNGDWLSVNAMICEILGYSEAELLKTHFIEFTYPDDIDADVQLIEDCLRGEISHYQLQKRYVHKSGRLVEALLSVSLVRDAQGEPQYFVSQMQDISELKTMQRGALEQAATRAAMIKERELSAQKAQMMIRIAHEFRTPLSVIATSLDMLERYANKMTAERRQEHMTKMRDEIRHITQMLDKIAFVIRQRQRQEWVKPLAVDVAQLAEQVSKRLCAERGDAREVRVKVQGGTPLVQTEGEVFDMLFERLFSNALKFSSGAISINVDTDVAAKTVRLTIVDSGIGIPAADLPHVRTPFYRGSNIGEVAGLGLGLTIAEQALELVDGSLSVESVVRQGTIVTVTLPLHVDPSEHHPIHPLENDLIAS